ncbi:hypothetical protein AB0F91_11450 [Amycolatopsis sp. NPDC023774]|uniref:hypothetical protein n=1 Tax=Amycolatopsis sp. NPDC023774 TaxID=3155015 RepID=UPI0033FBB539
MTEVLGFLLVIQGPAGSSPGRRLDEPQLVRAAAPAAPRLHIAAGGVMLAVGAAVLFAGQTGKRRRDHL